VKIIIERCVTRLFCAVLVAAILMGCKNDPPVLEDLSLSVGRSAYTKLAKPSAGFNGELPLWNHACPDKGRNCDFILVPQHRAVQIIGRSSYMDWLHVKLLEPAGLFRIGEEHWIEKENLTPIRPPGAPDKAK
jgi:hypothetical protein